MPDKIHLLPEPLINQIAAGEVVQRPASVVKELLENSLDAGAKNIVLEVRDGGKTYMRVSDDGCGMSPTDARMSFERHATSKIRNADDLYAIHTMGFRGEALASIAAVAQVEMKTRRPEDELGTHIIIHGGKLITQQPTACPPGTTIEVKQLYYNTPARRKFLKSNTTELTHILREFKRIAIPHPEVRFDLIVDDKELFILPATRLKQRIVALFDKKLDEQLIPVREEVDDIAIHGWITLPEAARKKRPESMFFVNNRFVRSPYLHHAVRQAYGELLSDDLHPMYFLLLHIPPTRVDVNVHPTKQEVKFDDEHLIYRYVASAVRHALGQYSLSPLIDFQSTPDFSNPHSHKSSPFPTPATSSPNQKDRSTSRRSDWEQVYEIMRAEVPPNDPPPNPTPSPVLVKTEQFHNRYIFASVKEGVLIVHQQHAFARIYYEELKRQLEAGPMSSQQLVFPHPLDLPPDKILLLEKRIPHLRRLGFAIEPQGSSSYVLQGIPSLLSEWNADPTSWITLLLDAHPDTHSPQGGDALLDQWARSLAVQMASYKRIPLNADERQWLIDRLFECEMPSYDPRGRKCFVTWSLDSLDKMFQNP